MYEYLNIGIKTTYPAIKATDYQLRDDGNGIYIAKWIYPGSPQPTDLAALNLTGQNAYNANLYKQQRTQAYPDIGDQLDAIYQAIVALKTKTGFIVPTDTANWMTTIANIKTQYPKPS